MHIGVIGLGSIGMRHVKSLLALGHTVYGADMDASKEHAACALGASLLTGQARDRLDGLLVATPTHDHAHYLLAQRPTFIEKPIADLAIDKTAVSANVIMVGYNQRFNPAVQGARTALPFIGKPIWARFTCSQYNGREDYLRDGVILNWSHEIDLALYLLGQADLITSHTKLNYGTMQDVMTDILLNQSGCVTSIHLDYLTAPEVRSFTIAGTEGVLHADLLDRTVTKNGNLITRGIGTIDDDYLAEMEAFTRRIKGEYAIGCTVKQAIDVLDICLQVRRAAGL